MIETSILMGNGKVSIGTGNILFDSKKVKIPTLIFDEIIADSYNIGDTIDRREVELRNKIRILIPTLKAIEQIEEKIKEIKQELETQSLQETE